MASVRTGCRWFDGSVPNLKTGVNAEAVLLNECLNELLDPGAEMQRSCVHLKNLQPTQTSSKIHWQSAEGSDRARCIAG